MMDRRILAKLIEVHDLPTLPEVMAKILEMVEDERTSAADLTALLECDQAISARLLRWANSAFYGLRYEVDSVHRAVVVLGFNTVRQLALATSVFDTLAGKRQFALDPSDFWMHSLGAAKASQVLCLEHCRVDSPAGCFTAALLHDIGKYLYALLLKDEYKVIVTTAMDSRRLVKDVEREELEMTHAEVGQWFAERWRFPPLIVDAIGNLYRVSAYNGQYKTEVAAVALADEISRRSDFGLAGDVKGLGVSGSVLRTLGITDSTVDEVAEELNRHADETRLFLNLLTGAPAP